MRGTRRRVRAALTALATTTVGVLALTGCTVTTPGTGARVTALPLVSPSPRPTATGTVDFNDCTKLITPSQSGISSARAKHLTFSCGKLPVPLDPANPAAGTVALYVLKVHDDRAPDARPLVVDPGGPGGSAVSLAVSLAGQVADDVLTHYDIVGVDPRGVGLSDPVKCLDDATKDKVFAAAPDVRTPEGVAEAQSLAATWVAGCTAGEGASLPDYNTVYAAADMDRVRQALGSDKLDYLGFSYGTLLGAVYAHQFPTAVGRMVLDGAVDPGQSFLTGAEVQAGGFESAFGQFAADCATRPACAALGDPATAVRTLAATATTSGGIPSSTAGETRRATAGVLYSAVGEALYDKSEWSTLGDALLAAQKGDGKGLLALADEYYQRDSSGHYTNLYDAYTTVTCNDQGTTFTPDQLTAIGNDWAAKYPVFGAYFAGQMAMCNGWPASGHPSPTSVAAPGAAPIVVVGTVHDPATPYANTAALAGSLGTGVVVSWDGQGHTAYLKNTCVDKAVNDYLLTGTSPAANTSCPA